MIQVGIREIKRADQLAVEEIYSMHWQDQGFREKLLKRLLDFFEQTDEIKQSDFHYYVAIDADRNIVGIAGTRTAPDAMQMYSVSNKPLELYVIAVKENGKGIGKALVNKVISEARQNDYTEIILYSGETHKDSWSFYEHLGFQKVQDAKASNGEMGTIWRWYL